MKNILLVETSSALGGVSLVETDDEFENSKLRDFLDWEKTQSHSEVITSAVKLLLDRSQIDLKNIDLYAVSTGPGSFTGIRVGLNMLKAFAYAFDKPLFCYSSLEALALSSEPQELPILCLNNAFKNSIYAAKYSWSPQNGLSEEVEPQVISPVQVRPLIEGPSLVLGDAYDLYHSLFPRDVLSFIKRDKAQPDSPQVQIFSPRLAFHSTRHPKNHWKSVQALYIRPSEAEEKLKMGLLKPLPRF